MVDYPTVNYFWFFGRINDGKQLNLQLFCVFYMQRRRIFKSPYSAVLSGDDKLSNETKFIEIGSAVLD